MTQKQLEDYLWGAANILRGMIDSATLNNPMLTYVFSLMDYVEEKGFGMKILRSLYKDFDLPLREYAFQVPYLSVSFPRNMEAVTDVSEHKRIGELPSEELNGFEWIKSQGEVSAKKSPQRRETYWYYRTSSRFSINSFRRIRSHGTYYRS